MYNCFKSSKQHLNTKELIGFDIETCDSNKEFVVASLVGLDGATNLYYSKQELISHIKTGKFNDCIIVATNLSFDFFGTFFGKDSQGFNFIFRGSDLLYAKTYIYNQKFNKKSNHHKTSVTFLDTLNYAKLSVEELGKIVGIPKLKKPSFLGYRPKNKEQWDELIKYNINDSLISVKALDFFYRSFEELGATPKLTLASTSMSLYKNKYLKGSYWRHDEDILLELFKGYYGGRTEAFARGSYKDYNYYDFNSLYPSVMLNKFPDPNSMMITRKNSDFYIMNYEGMSDVSVFCPFNTKYPILPVRTETKLIFPIGSFRGYYCHNELREAIDNGYTIQKVHKSIYYKKTCEPFKDFVNDLYQKRLEYKKKGSKMEKVVKILLNSLYGKFGQKFRDKDNVIPFDHTVEELDRLPRWTPIGKDGNYIRVLENKVPPPFCIPIWASYVTAYGRIKLHKAIKYANPLYVDTDSLITKKTFKNSLELGDLKLEHYIKFGIIVKPKFYGLQTETQNKVKVKGIGTKLVFDDLEKLLIKKNIKYIKFTKFREALRRGLIPNQLMEVTKHLNLNDDKRIWEGDFNPEVLEHSRPILVTDGEIDPDQRRIEVNEAYEEVIP